MTGIANVLFLHFRPLHSFEDSNRSRMLPPGQSLDQYSVCLTFVGCPTRFTVVFVQPRQTLA